jgi:acyl carrier protein
MPTASPPDTADIASRVIDCVVKTQHLEPARVRAESTFQELEIDSLAGINILFSIEEEFNITVPDDAGQRARTVQDLIDGVRLLLEQKNESAREPVQ